MVEHELRVLLCCCLDAKVAKHGVRLPASKQLDGVCTDVGAEESCGSPRAQRACRQQGVRDTSRGFKALGGVT